MPVQTSSRKLPPTPSPLSAPFWLASGFIVLGFFSMTNATWIAGDAISVSVGQVAGFIEMFAGDDPLLSNLSTIALLPMLAGAAGAIWFAATRSRASALVLIVAGLVQAGTTGYVVLMIATYTGADVLGWGAYAGPASGLGLVLCGGALAFRARRGEDRPGRRGKPSPRTAPGRVREESPARAARNRPKHGGVVRRPDRDGAVSTGRRRLPGDNRETDPLAATYSRREALLLAGAAGGVVALVAAGGYMILHPDPGGPSQARAQVRVVPQAQDLVPPPSPPSADGNAGAAVAAVAPDGDSDAVRLTSYRSEAGHWTADLPSGGDWGAPVLTEPSPGELFRTEVRDASGNFVIIDFTVTETPRFSGPRISTDTVVHPLLNLSERVVFDTSSAIAECDGAVCVDYLVPVGACGGYAVLAGGPDQEMMFDIARATFKSLAPSSFVLQRAADTDCGRV